MNRQTCWTGLFGCLWAIVAFSLASSVEISLSDAQMPVEIPEDLEPIKEIIIDKLVTPEDGKLEREIKSLFAQYILLAAMDAANSSNSSTEASSTGVSSSPINNYIEEPLFPVRAEVSSSPTYQQAYQPQQQQQTPQVIYVYVTPPTEAPRTEASNVRTKKTKPTKPPKTKKPRPGHHDNDQQRQQPPQQTSQPQVIYVQQPQPPQQAQTTPSYLQLQLQIQQLQLQQQQQQQQQQLQSEIASQTTLAPPPTSPAIQATQPPQTIVVVQQPPAATPAPPTPSVPILTPPPSGASGAGGDSAAAAPAATLPPITPRPGPSQEHVLNQVDLILQNVAKGNITGIVDQSLAIRAPMPVRNLVNGILNTVFCNPINRLLGRCRGRSEEDTLQITN